MRLELILYFLDYATDFTLNSVTLLKRLRYVYKRVLFTGGMTRSIVLCLFSDTCKTMSGVSILVWQRVTAVINETLKALNSKFIVGGIFFILKRLLTV